MGKKGVQRSIRIYLSKLKKPVLRLPSTPNATSAVASRLLSACKYPKTPSLSRNGNGNGDGDGDGNELAATLSDVDRFLYDNFHSLYFQDSVFPPDEYEYSTTEPSSESPKFADPPSDVRPSHRFFVSPGTSNSLIDEARASAASSPSSPTSSSSGSNEGLAVPGGGVAVTTFTKEPYEDFRRSMQEMVEARHPDPSQPLDWDFMEELLFCYLGLNDRSVHRHILKAFADLVASIRRQAPPRRRHPGGKGRRPRPATEAEAA